MLYNALSVGKKTHKISPVPFVISLQCVVRQTCWRTERHTDIDKQTCSLQYFATPPAGEVTFGRLLRPLAWIPWKRNGPILEEVSKYNYKTVSGLSK